ncbi:Exopolygalacturonase [Actinidia chinensis var. chinensis]|uniref:Exopolygalacturonase n=1 Tax=Actinidia chinensis var. chinensis TaxID=1590841 RepID=A0A2R6QCF9_ACTCC|nr:Exopolygalacturonase [Actinidia chinensis var. chinensis]
MKEMGSVWLIMVVGLVVMSTTTITTLAQTGGRRPVFFDVTTYGAMADGKTDNSMAFSKAWTKACEWKYGKSVVFIPKGTYMVNSVIFRGPCSGPITFIIKGVLKASTDPKLFFTDHWIGFQYVDGLVVKGGGYLDGQGPSAWPYNDCSTNPNCKPLPTTMRFDFVSNSRVHHLRSINSKNSHFNLFACTNMNMSHIRISAPEDSPNTDGIHIGDSSNINVARAHIATGDDCIAMVSGSRDIHISGVSCGPGHGISIGSLGKSKYVKETVTGVTIVNCTLTGTQNGVRIKTWAPSSPSIASDLTFQYILMEDVNNPIIIDQQYCPQPNCNSNAYNSEVQISNVTFKNIWGTSSSKVAVNIKCSGIAPCQNIKLVNINLSYNGLGGPAISSCSNVRGRSYGTQNPPGCL